MYYILLYFILLYYIIFFIYYYSILHYIILYYIILYYFILFYFLYYIVLYYILLYYIIYYYSILHYIILYYIILYYILNPIFFYIILYRYWKFAICTRAKRLQCCWVSHGSLVGMALWHTFWHPLWSLRVKMMDHIAATQRTTRDTECLLVTTKSSAHAILSTMRSGDRYIPQPFCDSDAAGLCASLRRADSSEARRPEDQWKSL